MHTRREPLEKEVTVNGPGEQISEVKDTHSAAGNTSTASKPGGISIPRIRSVIRREDTVVRYGGTGDNWHMTWANDDRQYVGLCDGAGFDDNPQKWHNSRMLAISGGPRDARFHDLPGYPTLARPEQQHNDPRYYNFGTLALDGNIYQFMSTFDRSFPVDDSGDCYATDPVCFNGVKLICSPDNGRSWRNQDGSQPVVWESWSNRSRDTMVFFEEDQNSFSLLSVLQMGRNYEHNHDGYVYVYAPNGSVDGRMNQLVMFRVPKKHILDRKSYEFFAGLSSDGGARWTGDIDGRGIVHTFPRGWVNKWMHPYAWQPSVVYNAPLGLYMMANWGMGSASGVDVYSGRAVDDLWFAKPSYLGFWVAPNPWGPWTQIHEELAWLPAGDKNARAYQPQIAPKWIAGDGRSFWLVWTDFQVTDQETLKSLAKSDGRDTAGIPNASRQLQQVSATMRKCMPYYTFNTQRVDLVVE